MKTAVKRIIFIFSIVFLLMNTGLVFAGTYVLNVSLKNWDGTPASNLTFPGAGNVTTDNPWIRSPQYLRVIYSSTETTWGIRIVTDNEGNIGQVYPKPLNKGPDNQWEWDNNHPDWGGKYKYENGQWQTGDDSISFSGLLDSATKNNPNYRPALAWQVFAQPVVEPDSIYKIPFTNVWNVGGDWNDDWVYLVDKSNKWNGEDVIGGVFYPPPPVYSLKTEIVANGSGQLGWLAQHPVVGGSPDHPDPKYGDGWDTNGDGKINEQDDNDVNDDGKVECDMAIYIAACFGVPSDTQEGVFTATMPAGNYSSVIYLELIHE